MNNTSNRAKGGDAPLTHDQIERVLGRIGDAKAAAIAETGATLTDLEEAAAWAAGRGEVLGKMHRHASPVVAAIYDILTLEEKLSDERD